MFRVAQQIILKNQTIKQNSKNYIQPKNQNKFAYKYNTLNKINTDKNFYKQSKNFSIFGQQQQKSHFSTVQSEGIHINASNMEYFNINMDIFKSNQKYDNPSKVQNQKALDDVFYKQNMTVKELCEQIGADKELFSRSVKLIGVQNTEDQVLTFDEADVLCYEYDCKLLPENYKQLEKSPKSPVITIMGHVDHGKTTLLDNLRASNICDGEYGGITQKIGAFHTISPDGLRTTYIDTPGHEAFVNMRIRGASSTDMVVLVVSAIEGLQPQTLEVISIAQTNNLPIMVAINKIDVNGADPEEVENQLYEKGGLNLETKGGNIPVIHISAKKNINMELFKELILFETELLELQEHTQGLAEATVIESRKCPESGQLQSTILVQRGTLKQGDYLIVGSEYIKIKQMKDDRNSLVGEALPSHAVEVFGLKNLARSGETCFVVENENKAKLVCQRRKWINDQKKGEIKQISASASKIKFSTRRERRKFHSGNKELIKMKFDQIEENLLAKISIIEEIQSQRELEQFEMDELVRAKVDLEMHREYVQSMIQQQQANPNAVNLIFKANDFGTKETLVAQVYQLTSKFKDVEFNLISSGVGAINENDIREASLSNATIIAMDVPATPEAIKLAKQEGIKISSHRIIYTILDELKQTLNSANNIDKVELLPMGNGVVKNVFKVKAGKGKNSQRTVAGINVIKGTINKKYVYNVTRNGQVIGEKIEIANLKHFKNEVNEIKKGEECGIIFFEYDDIQPGDQIEAYEVQDSA